jgi:hypothetical protein
MVHRAPFMLLQNLASQLLQRVLRFPSHSIFFMIMKDIGLPAHKILR